MFRKKSEVKTFQRWYGSPTNIDEVWEDREDYMNLRNLPVHISTLIENYIRNKERYNDST